MKIKACVEVCGLAAAAATAFIWAGCSGKAPPPAPSARPVVTAVVQPPAARQRSFSAMTRAEKNIELSFRVGGEIVELPAKMGMRIRQGELVARLDAADYELQARQAEAQLAQAEAQLRQAEAELSRIRSQYEANIASESDWDNARAAHNSAAAARDAARKNKELADQQVAHCVLLCPADGVVASVPVELHKTVSAGDAVAALSSGEAIDVELGVPDVLISGVGMGMEADVVFKAFSGLALKARVVEVGVTADTQTRTYPVRLRLVEADERIRPGMTCEAVFEFGGSAPEKIVVPAVAVVPTPGGERYVWVYKPESGSVEKRFVKIGDLVSSGLEIVGGLQAGEVIAVRGVHQLTEGMKVKLLEEESR